MNFSIFLELKQKSIKSGVIYPYTKSVRKEDLLSSNNYFKKLTLNKNSKIFLPNQKLEDVPVRSPDIVLFDTNNKVALTYGCTHSNIFNMSQSLLEIKYSDWKLKFEKDDKIIRTNKCFFQYSNNHIHTSIFQIHNLDNFKKLNNGLNYNKLLSMQTDTHKIEFIDKDIFSEELSVTTCDESVDQYTRCDNTSKALMEAIKHNLSYSGKLKPEKIAELINEKTNKIYAVPDIKFLKIKGKIDKINKTEYNENNNNIDINIDD